MASKKSKILAMALCASVMTGIYASPVMAANVNAKFDDDSGNIVFTISGDTYTINKDDITKAIERNHIHSNGQISANAGFIANGGSYYAIRGTNNQYTMLANEKYFALGSGGLLKGPEGSDNYNTTKERATFYVDNATGDVTTKGTLSVADGDFKVDENGAVTAAVGSNIAGVQFNRGAIDFNNAQLRNIARVTSQEYISGHSKFEDVQLTLGREENQVLTAAKLGVINDVIQEDGSVVSKGDVKSNLNGKEYSLNQVGHNTEGITNTSNSKNAETTIQGTLKVKDNGSFQNADGSFRVNANGEIQAAGGKFYVDKYGNVKNVGTVDGVDVSELEGKFNTTNENVAGIERTDVTDGVGTTTIEGDFAVNGKDNTFGSKNGSFTVNAEDGTFTAANGAFKVREGVGETVIAGSIISSKDQFGNQGTFNGSNLNLQNADHTRNTSIDAGTAYFVKDGSGTSIDGGDITAETLNGKVIDDLVEGSDIADDLANIGGIERSEGAGDPGTGTTTIENNLKVSGDKINMFGGSGLTFDKGTMNNVNVINVSGNIGFDGDNVHFSYGSDDKTTTLGGLALTVDQIANDVSTIKDHFTVDDKGNVTISADDGSSLTVGNNGTSTGQGGQVTTDGNHTVNGDLDVDGSGQIDKDLTVGGDLEVGGKIDASEVNVGNTHITKDNGIETDKITVSGQGGSAIINGGYVGGSNDVFIDANGNNIFDEGETSLSGVNGKVDKVASDLGDVSILDPEIAGDSNGDGQNDVVGAVNNEAEIRRNEIERVDGRINNLENRVGELEDRIDKVGAMAAAIANLRTMGYDPAAPTEVAVGIGQYRDETGAALGLFHYPNRDFMLSLSVSTSGDEVMGGIGATWKFGRKSPEKVAEIKKAQAEADARRAEEAKLAKAEEMKQAAKEAKIKAQQERHAKLAAERAAQAEAAK